MGRRQVAESVNAALKGAFTDLGRGFMRVMGVTKMTVMLGFTLAAFNLDRIRSFRAKHLLDEQGRSTQRPKKTRARRRVGTWSDVIETDGPAAPVANSAPKLWPVADGGRPWRVPAPDRPPRSGLDVLQRRSQA